jgi:hypothetical protein
MSVSPLETVRLGGPIRAVSGLVGIGATSPFRHVPAKGLDYTQEPAFGDSPAKKHFRSEALRPVHVRRHEGRQSKSLSAVWPRTAAVFCAQSREIV